ncbi:MAG: sigma-70 family RNA polymerase sigma factor [Clostridia bacterium]|nr:sigma-70 family RNA polymerase sigma factor [Clostridia bacterium]
MDDKVIIDLFFDRKDSAIEQTQLKYGAICFRIADSILDSSEDSEECVNDALMKLWNSIPPDNPLNFKAYIIRIVRNLSLDRLRYRNSSKRCSASDIPLSELEACISGGEKVDSHLEAEELGCHINDFLRGLTAESRFIFIGRYWHYRSIKSLASEFGMTTSKVKSLLFRLRKSLREELEKEGYTI